jgi:hypothetical protein
VGDALARKDWAAAEGYSRGLLVQSDTSWEDRLRHLRILRQHCFSEQNCTEFDWYLKSLQELAATNSDAVCEVASWMTANELACATVQWLTNVPTSIRSAPQVAVSLCQAYARAAAWSSLETFLLDHQWAQFEFLRLAWLSRVAREQKRPQSADAQWRVAVQLAGNQLGAFRMLLAMASSCGQENEDLLWRITRRFPQERWAFTELRKTYATAGNTSCLYRLALELMNLEPKDWVAKNDFAATAMLLKMNCAKAYATACDLYAERPGDTVITSTYAYSLHLRGRTKEGLEILEKFPLEMLEIPAVSAYYGVLLAADGQTNKACRYLRLARKTELLPEERLLIDQSLNLEQNCENKETE